MNIHPLPTKKMKHAYWIHGKRASGKSILAERIIGQAGQLISARSTKQGIIGTLKTCEAVAIDEFVEKKSPLVPTLITALNNSAMARGSTDGKTVESIYFDNLEVLVITSQDPPKDPSLRHLFRIIEIS